MKEQWLQATKAKSFYRDCLKTHVSKYVTMIVQTSGVGKTHYLMSHAVTDNIPTVYIDAGKGKDCLLEDLISEITTTGISLPTHDERSKLAQVCFFCFLDHLNRLTIPFHFQQIFENFFLSKIVCFLGFVNLMVKSPNSKIRRKLEFSDFLRFSMPSNQEGGSYYPEIFSFIYERIKNYDRSSISCEIRDQLEEFGIAHQDQRMHLVIDKAEDLYNCYDTKMFASRREYFPIKIKPERIIHPFFDALLSFRCTTILEVAATCFKATEPLLMENTRNQNNNVGFQLISNFEDGTELLDVMRDILPIECFYEGIEQDYRKTFANTSSKIIVENISKFWKTKQLTDLLKIDDLTPKNHFTGLLNSCFQNYPELCCKLFMCCLLPGHPFESDDDLRLLMEQGLVSLVGFDNHDIPTYAVEPLMVVAMREISGYSTSENDPTKLNQFLASMK